MADINLHQPQSSNHVDFYFGIYSTCYTKTDICVLYFPKKERFLDTNRNCPFQRRGNGTFDCGACLGYHLLKIELQISAIIYINYSSRIQMAITYQIRIM